MQTVDFDNSKHFGEGICPLNADSLIELTWKERTVRILNRDSLRQTGTVQMWSGVKEGWGITSDLGKKILYVSDGTEQMTRVDAQTLQ